VFNFADACISVGVVLLLLFYRNELRFDNQEDEQAGESK
jgi:lipoprotein signal peptidase